MGFGKTEGALRAAFVAAMAGCRWLWCAPPPCSPGSITRISRSAFAASPLKVGRLSRLVPQAEAKATKEGADRRHARHRHRHPRLLAKGLQFKRMGLVIVDEEQRFGVVHKEQLKQLEGRCPCPDADGDAHSPHAANGDVGPARTVRHPDAAGGPAGRAHRGVAPWDGVVMREALLREHYRGGQSFIVVPRISDLPTSREFLRKDVPEVRPIVAHGQMAASEVEERMSAFYDKRYEVLLSTTIVERAGYSERQHDDRASRRSLRAGAALSVTRARGPVEDAGLCLHDDATGPHHHRNCAEAVAGPVRPRHAGRGLSAGEP